MKREYRGGGRKKNPKKEVKKDTRSKELKAKMRKNTEINSKHFKNQKKGMKANINPRFDLCKKYINDYYMGGF